ncbi:MAG: OmpW family protein [Cyclobacteriaceae bacterium]|nr:OmpW family protein [Cyclobacteriaceae bacterium]MDX5467791.1 OmpW family protein [Cyclobacteriaceae bacterium]
MKKIFIILLVIGICSLGSVSAQQSITTTSYSVGIPTGNLGEYISSASFRGISFDYRKLIQPNVGIGFYTAWNVFYEEKPYDTYELGNQSLSGRQFRYTNSFPIMFATDYYFKPGEDLNPFIGGAIGGVYTERATDMGIYRLEQDGFSLGFTPQIGFIYKVSTFSAISISAKYNIALAAGDLDNSQNFLSINLGYAFMGN